MKYHLELLYYLLFLCSLWSQKFNQKRGKNKNVSLFAKNERIISISRTTPNAPYSEFFEHTVSGEFSLPKIEGVIDGLVYFPGYPKHSHFSSLHQAVLVNQLDCRPELSVLLH